MVITQHIHGEEIFGSDIRLAVMFGEDVPKWEYDIFFS